MGILQWRNDPSVVSFHDVMSSEVNEVAKATQELAKTTAVAIDATSKLGAFVARVIGEPVDVTVGILSDKLKFMRWERQMRLHDRWKAILHERGIKNTSHVLSPKLALPIIENASLEEDDVLQDLWADLLATAMDPERCDNLRAAYIEILRQLEALDVTILYNSYKQYVDFLNKKSYWRDGWTTPTYFELDVFRLSHESNVSNKAYEISIDNLMRVRCLAPYLSTKEIYIADGGEARSQNFSTQDSYDSVCLTALGVAFVEACMKHKGGI